MNQAIISVTAAPLYKAPDSRSTLSDEVLHGMAVEILEEAEAGFYKIKTQYFYEGFIHRSNLNFDKALADKWIDSQLYVVSHPCADVLSVPRVQGSLTKFLVKGGLVIKTGQDEKGFTKILTAGGEEGYIRTRFLGEPIPKFGTLSEKQFRNCVIETAKQYWGVQYRWGGKTPLGIDCSGLAAVCYFLSGVTIYRDAVIKEGFPVKETTFDKLKTADLIFFPGHVAIYIGNGKYIHSSISNDGVSINSLDPADGNYREDLADTITGYGTIF